VAAVRSIFIYCDGGFGNRYNAMLSGLVIAEAAGLEPVIVWPVNNWCGASYEDIFEIPRVVQNRELISFVAEKDHQHHLMVEDHLRMNVTNASPNDFQDFSGLLNYVQASDKDLFYYVALIPPYIDMGLVKKHILANPFRSTITARADAFIRERNLSEFFGIQIRKTDFGSGGADDQNLFDLISQRADKTFFVCSDDKDVERRFAALANVCIYDKQAHVEKLVDGEWNSHTADSSGRVYACNVNRGALSVVEAIVDLLILSRSQVVRTSGSTFLNAALMLQACRAD
jgi:hypothetical protein